MKRIDFLRVLGASAVLPAIPSLPVTDTPVEGFEMLSGEIKGVCIGTAFSNPLYLVYIGGRHWVGNIVNGLGFICRGKELLTSRYAQITVPLDFSKVETSDSPFFKSGEAEPSSFAEVAIKAGLTRKHLADGCPYYFLQS